MIFSASKCLASNAYLMGVFDGHAGAACSRNVSTRLYDYYSAAVLRKHLVADIPLVERLQWLFSNADPALLLFANEQHEKNVAEFFKKYYFYHSNFLYIFFERFKANNSITSVRKAIQSAFMCLDTDLSNGAMPNSLGQVCK